MRVLASRAIKWPTSTTVHIPKGAQCAIAFVLLISHRAPAPSIYGDFDVSAPFTPAAVMALNGMRSRLRGEDFAFSGSSPPHRWMGAERERLENVGCIA